MTLSIRRYIFTLIAVVWIFGLGGVIAGDKPEEEFSYYQTKYPDEAAVFTLRKQEVNYALVNDSIQTTIKVYEEIIHLGENTVRYAGEKVYTSTFLEVQDLKAYTLVPQKRKYERVEVTNFKKSYDTNSGVFYDDTKEISFTYPAVQKGVKTVVEYTKIIKDPRMIGLYYINTYLPVDKSVYTVTYGDQIEVNPQFKNTEGLNIREEKNKTEENLKRISYTIESVDKIKFEAKTPSYALMASSIYCPILHYKNSEGKSIDVISSQEALHKWYRTFIKDLDQDDPEVKKLVDSIVNSEDDELEKIRKIYGWVQANIKYIAFEDGMRGLIPHPGGYVIEKRYGDCKDMSSALVSMLRAAGIKAHYTWVGTRDLPYQYSDVASPITDNHMIATVILDGKTYFLDATGQYLPLDMPSSMIQGKECLISLKENQFMVEKAPVMPKEINLMADSVFITLDDGTVKGEGKVALTGYARFFNAHKLIKSTQKSVDGYLRRLLAKGSNKFQLGEYQIENLDDPYQPIIINYDFTIPDYFKQIGENIYINLVLDKTMTDALLENRTVPIENDYKYINRSVVTVDIPEGFELKSLPDDAQSSNEIFGYKIHYEVNGDKLLVNREFYIDYLLMYPDQFDSWNKIISEYAGACRKALIFSKIN